MHACMHVCACMYTVAACLCLYLLTSVYSLLQTSMSSCSDSIKVLSRGPLSVTDWVGVVGCYRKFMPWYSRYTLCFLQQTDHLLTAKMVESISMATTSLISLVSLLDKVKNMVISDHIQAQVSGQNSLNWRILRLSYQI